MIGVGGMGEVYRAYDTARERMVAIKLLRPEMAADHSFQERFRRESRVAARLQEPHVIPVHNFGEIDGQLYIDMRLVEGASLKEVLRRDGPLQPQRAVAIIRQVASALDDAHANGLVHRDIKPANILFTEFGGVKIADFGVAKSPDTPQTLTNRVFGTMAYLPSDRIAGRPATPSDDLYALGVVAYEALTGRRAYPQDNLSALADAIAAGQLAPLTSLRPDVDPALAATIERAMARDPRWRFATAEQMCLSLDPPAPRSRRAGVGLASAAVLLIVVLVALMVVA